MIKISDVYSLRLLEVNDTVALFTILDSQREQMRVWLPFVDLTQSAEDIKKSMKTFATPENPQFCIMRGEEVIGLIGFKDTDQINRKTEIGYWLSFDYQGKGVMTQAVEKLLEYAFGIMKMHRVTIKAAEKNKKSRNVPQRLGFVQEGIERESELLVDGLHADIVVYSMLKREYLEKVKNGDFKISQK